MIAACLEVGVGNFKLRPFVHYLRCEVKRLRERRRLANGEEFRKGAPNSLLLSGRFITELLDEVLEQFDVVGVQI